MTANPSTAPAAMPSDAIVRLVASVMGRDNHALAVDTARKIEALFAPILEEKERLVSYWLYQHDQGQEEIRQLSDDITFSEHERKALEARALAAEAALAAVSKPNVEIRRNDDGSIDEVVATGVSVHLEQMDAGAWFLGLDAGEQTWQFWLRAKNPRTKVDIYHEQSAAAIRAQGE